jgi:HAD superfamily hydrolase (TIGR01509 family)
MRISRPTDLTRIIDQTQYLLLDFDGPICSIFTGTPASTVANQLRNLLLSDGVPLHEPPPQVDDPLEVLRFTSSLGPAAAERVESALRAAELAASRTARPTPHAREVILACQQTGRPVAIISNNSQVAVEAYLAAHGLAQHVDVVVGRVEPHPNLLKPSPHLVLRALRALNSPPRSSTLVGDSVSDIESAHAAGTHSVGFANKPGKYERLGRAGAGAVVTTLAELEAALLAQGASAN